MVRVAVMVKPDAPIEVRDVPEPELGEGDVLLDTIYSEVCGTDLHLQHGRLAGVPYPIIPGHVTVGRVRRIAGTVAPVEGPPLREGEIVTFLDVHRTCHSCWYCLVAKASTRCPSRKVYGITYGLADGLTGGWSERMHLKAGTKIIRLPASVPPERMIGGGCGLPTALHAIDRASLRLGDRIAIQGVGPVGLNLVILARLSGAGRVIAIGAPRNRLDAAVAFGADDVIALEATSPEERIARVQELTGGRGADVTIEATGVPGAVREGMRMTRDAGRLVVVGQYTNAGEAAFNPHADLNRKHLEIRGCWGSDYSHFHRAVEILARHGDRVPWERMISRRYGLEEMNEALADVQAGRAIKAVVDSNAAPS
ncbi:MAG: zinc-binding dehydrogenase [Planctomycetes bacterium]|nr:zinc-binding dehydrogenase [Planctomycetota bacterium]